VDLRVSNRAKCRSWLERVLLSLEKQGVLNAIRERRPAHYHVALFPSQYENYVARLTNGSVRLAAAEPAPQVADVAAQAGDGGDGAVTIDYRVNRGETLWSIARQHGVSVNAIKQVNDLSSSRIKAGQVLTIPVAAPPQ
jgi:cell envelope opacity-associated protein A